MTYNELWHLLAPTYGDGEAKAIVDGAPATVKEKVAKDEAEANAKGNYKRQRQSK